MKMESKDSRLFSRFQLKMVEWVMTYKALIIVLSFSSFFSCSDMLKMGKSKPWPIALEKLTGSRNVDISAITEYFKPLNDWLVKQRQEIGYAPPGWDESPTIPSSTQPGPTAGVPLLSPVILNVMVLTFTTVALIW